jgi:two-component system sensor histidine kinase UhpB
MSDHLRVLLIEDAPDDAELALFALAERWPDLRSQRVEDAAQLQAALAEPWDVVISDYNLPRFDAGAALALLRAHDDNLPFIVVSGFVGEESAADMMNAGADDFVMKGNLPRLPLAVDRALRQAAVHRQHRQAQEALRLSEKRLRAITDALGEGVFVTDPHGTLRWMNPEAERLLGWSENELIGQPIHPIVHRPSIDAPPSDPNRCGSLLALRLGEAQRIEDDTYLHRDGTPIDVAVVATPLFEDGQLVGAVTVMQDIRARKAARQELLDARRRSQELSAHLQSVREEERTRIARELHDELGQMLTALKIDVSWLRQRVPADETPLQNKIGGMTRLIDDTVDWVRRMSAELRPVMLDDLGLRAAIEWLLEGFSQRHGIPCHLDADDGDFRLPGDSGTAAFRIVQECLTNVARHAGASEVCVGLHQQGDRLEVSVSDNGRGFDAGQRRPQRSFGLLGIRERAENLGGSCTIDTTPGHGTRVAVRLPLTTPEEPTC